MISSVSTSPPAAPELALPADGAASPAARRARSSPGLVSALAADSLSRAAVAVAAPAKPRASGVASKAKTTGAGYATAASAAKAGTAKKTTTAKKPGPLDFLDDKKLSIEEKLLKLLAYLNDKWNKELDQKLKEVKTGTAAKAAAPSGSASKPRSSGIGGLVGKAVGFAKKAFPEVGVALDVLSNPVIRSVLSKVAGPGLAALATAAGLPALAPAALKLGPELVDAAAGLASAGDGGGAAAAKAPGGSATGATASSSAAGKETAEGIGSDRDAQLKLMEIQRIMDQQKEMFALTSNLLRTGHEARMAVIQNVR